VIAADVKILQRLEGERLVQQIHFVEIVVGYVAEPEARKASRKFAEAIARDIDKLDRMSVGHEKRKTFEALPLARECKLVRWKHWEGVVLTHRRFECSTDGDCFARSRVCAAFQSIADSCLRLAKEKYVTEF
jgi:hypothetical protein